MPELPEVESLRRGLERAVVGDRVKKVTVKKPKLVSGKGNIRLPSRRMAAAFESGLTGERILGIERRAKNLVFRFTHGRILLVHLKMSGQFVYMPRTSASKKVIGGHPIELSEKVLPNKHTHVIFELGRGTLYYNDTRMFGYLLYYSSAEAFEKENHFGMFGLEPLDPAFTPKYLKDALALKKGRIKAVLMDQKVVTGLGNIYADESLFAARIRPERSAASIGPLEARRLHAAIRGIIARAIHLGGSSVATYRLLDDSRGNYAREHKVYGKAGEGCPRCGRPLKRTVVQSRTTVFCAHCQR